MRTLIELYDKEPILNIIAACAIHPTPENIVFLGDFSSQRKLRNIELWTEDFLRSRKIETNVKFVDINPNDCSQIIETLFDVESRYEDCVLEVSGGSDLMLLAAGMFAENVDIPIFRFDVESQKFADVRGMESAEKYSIPVFTASEIFRLAHAGVVGHGHFKSRELDLSVRQDAREIWYIFLANRSRWHHVVTFFQNAHCEEGNELAISHKGVSSGLNAETRRVVCQQLAQAQLIRNLNVNGNYISFTIKNDFVKAILQDAGAALEIFTYSCIKSCSEVFGDCQISVCVDWDGSGPSETRNEIDVVAVSDAAPLFISCKSGRLENDHLNELFTLTSRFGGMLSRAVLMTTYTSSHTVDWLRQRAEDMGITLIGLADICPRVCGREYHGIEDCRTCANRRCERNLVNLLVKALDS